MRLTRSVPPPIEPAAVQLTWDHGWLFAWQPGGGQRPQHLAVAVATATGWVPDQRHVERRVLTTPSGAQPVAGYDVPSTLLLAPRETPDTASQSVRWFHALGALARELFASGRVLPVLEDEHGAMRARWAAVLDGDTAARVEALHAARPPVCVAQAAPSTEEMLGDLVRRGARHLMEQGWWRYLLPSTRDVHSRAARTAHRLLDGREPIANVHDRAERRALADIAAAFDRMRRRVAGEPVVTGRVRLGLPDDPTDPWPLQVELAGAGDDGRWCTAGDVYEGAPDAQALAGEPRFLGVLAGEVERVVTVLGEVVTSLHGAFVKGRAELPLEVAGELLERTDDLADAGVAVLAPAHLTRRSPTVRGAARPAVSGNGRFSREAIVDWSVTVDGEQIDDETLRRASEAGGSLVQVGGRWVRLDGAAARRALAAVERHRVEHGLLTAVGMLRLAAELEAEETSDPTVASVDEPPLRSTGWFGELLEGLPDDTLTNGDVPLAFEGTLRHYQERGLGWLQFLHRAGLGGCLADDMGLGKTPTTLAHLAALPGPHLVVCPLSVVRNWEREAARFTPMLRILVHHGAGRGRDEHLAHAIGAADLVITTYQVLVRDHGALSGEKWSVVVFDEAQAIKNPHTKAARAARHLQAEQVVALTGTPVENRLSDLWSILDLTTPGLLAGEQQFRTRFAQPIERHRDAGATAALRTLTSPFVLRRTKADRSLVPDLPDKIEQVAWAGLTREQAALYQGVVDQLLEDAQQATGMKRRGLVLAALTRLKQICNHPAHALGDGSRLSGRSGKLARFDELVDDLLEAGERALVFTQFKAMGELLVTHLAARNELHVPFLHGGVTKVRRDAMVDRFQSGDSPPLLLVSLKAGGTGLNLTAASRVVHYDRWWNPAVEDQATDRAWRIGQSRSVFVHKLVCQGTIEERVAALIDDKRALADAVVGTSGEAWLSELSTDELRELIVLDASAVEAGQGVGSHR